MNASRPLPVEPAPRRGRAGFTFLEILIVMGMLAVLLGLSIGFIGGVGKKALAMQAASILSESGNRCLNMSAGGKRATLDLREDRTGGDPRLVVTTSVLKTVLTANFSLPPKDQPGLEWFVNAAGSLEFARPSGNVSIDPDGLSGGAAKFAGQGSVDFGSRAGFAMTDGVYLDLWVKPDGGRGTSTLLLCDTDGGKLWKLELERLAAGGADAFAVVFTLWLVPAAAGEGVQPAPMRFQTTPAVRTKGSRVEASFDGREASIKIDGVERYVPDRRGARTPANDVTMRFAQPPSGVARILLSDPARPFSGLVDTLTVAGVFRTDEDVRSLPLDVTVVGRSLPWRVAFLNGALDPTDPATRAGDAVVWLAGPGDATSGGLYEIRFGRYGSIPPPKRVPAPGGVPPGAPPITPENR